MGEARQAPDRMNRRIAAPEERALSQAEGIHGFFSTNSANIRAKDNAGVSPGSSLVAMLRNILAASFAEISPLQA